MADLFDQLGIEPPTGSPSNTPKGTPSGDLFSSLGIDPPKTPQGKPSESLIGAFSEGLGAGGRGIAAMVTEAIPSQFKALMGDTEGARKDFEDYQKKIDEIQKMFPSDPSRLTNPKDLYQFALGSARLAGEGLPSLGATVAGGVGGFLTGGPPGAIAGAIGTSYLLNTPESYTSLLEAGVSEGNAASYALGVGALKSGLDFLPVGRLFGQTFGHAGTSVLTSKLLSKAGMKEAAAYVGKEAATQFAYEGVTEAAQEAIDVAAEEALGNAPEGFFSKNNIHRIAIAGYGGALVGGLTGGGASIINSARSKGDLTEEEQKADKVELSPELTQMLRQEEVTGEAPEDTGLVTTQEEAQKVLTDLSSFEPYAQLTDEQQIDAANKELSKGVEPIDINIGNNIRQLSLGDFKGTTLTNKELSSLVTPKDFSAAATVLFSDLIPPKTREDVLRDKLRVNTRTLNLKDLPEYVALKFHELGGIQRGYPEIQMIQTQGVIGSGVMGSAIEHIGDLTNRMAAHQSLNMGYDMFSDKVRSKYNSLHSGYGFEREFLENIKSNAKYKGIDENTAKKDSFESLQKYADEHKKIPVYNKLQYHAREAAVSLGERRFDDTREHLEYLHKFVADDEATSEEKTNLKEKYQKASTEYKMDSDGNLLELDREGNYIEPSTKPHPTPEEYSLKPQKYTYRDPLTNKEDVKNVTLWNKLAENLKGVSYKPQELTPETKSLQRSIENLIGQVGGPTVKVQFMKDLQEVTSKGTNPVKGAQVGNTIYLAQKLHQDKNLALDETALHEVWHYLYDDSTGLFTQEDRQAIEQGYPEIVSYLDKSYGENLVGSINDLYKNGGPEARQEIIATAFAKYATDKQQKNYLRGEPRGIFEKALRFLKNLGRAFTTNGYKNFADVFDKALEGDVAPEAVLHEAITDTQVARLSRISENYRKAQADLDMMKDFDALTKKAIQEAADQASNKENYSFAEQLYDDTANTIATPRHLSSKNPLMSRAYHIVEKWEEEQMNYLDRGFSAGKEYVNEKDQRVQQAANELLDHLRNTQQKVQLDPQGNLIYNNEEGRPVKMTNTRLAQVTVSLDQMYKEPLNIKEEIFRADIGQTLGHKISQQHPTTIKKKIAKELERKDLTPERKIKLETADFMADAIRDLQNMRQYAYYPHSRFGPYGITVHKKEDIDPKTGRPKPSSTPVVMGRIEEGKYKGKYSKDSYDDVMNDVNQYRGNPDYVISKIFNVTHQEVFSNLGDAAVSTEMILDMMLGAKNSQEYQEVLEAIKSKLKNRGFASRWSQSKNIAGYSKDGVRVSSTYMESSMRYLAKLKWKPQLDSLEEQLGLVGTTEKGRTLTEPVRDYIKYVTDPNMEYRNLVKFQYMWTMAANPSSAAIQMTTPFIMTTGNMSQFSPNIIKNWGLVASYSRKIWNALANSKAYSLRSDGSFVIRWDNVKGTKWLTDQEVEMLKKFYKTAKSGEQFVEDAMGKYAGESRTRLAKRAKDFDKMMNYFSLLMSGSEQLSRGISFLASFKAYSEDPKVLRRADRVLANDKLWQDMRATSTEPLVYDLALFTVQETHADFGKRARAKYNRGLGRIVIPFSHYPMSINEMLIRMAKRGPDGRRALAMTTLNIFMVAGLLGLPGAELAKELYEEIYKIWAQEGLDLEVELQNIVVEATGNKRLAKTITQGAPRGLFDFDIGPRLRQSVAGQDLLLAMLGVRGDIGSIGGVPSSALGNFVSGLQGLRDGDSVPRVAGDMLPSGLRNLFKAYQYATEGAFTRKDVQLVSAEEFQRNPKELFFRVMGFGTGRVADAREKQFWANQLNQKYRPKLNNVRSNLVNSMRKIIRETKKENPDPERIAQYREEYRKTFMKFLKYLRDNKLPYDVSAMNKAVQDATTRDLTGITYKDIDRIVRPEFGKIEKITKGE